MLTFLVEDLVSKGKVNEAKGVSSRHDVYHRLREETKEKLKDIVYDPKNDPPSYDIFGSLSKGDCLQLPKSVTVEWI